MTAETTRPGASTAGWVFAVSFFVGLFLVGDQAGAFADSDRAYAELFADSAHRVQDLIGSALLIVSAVAFAAFVQFMAPPLEPGSPRYEWSVLVRIGGTSVAAAFVVAGGALATVPASLVLGDFYGDPGIVTAQNVLPSLGYVMLVVGAVVAALLVMGASTRLGLFPRWFVRATAVVAVLLIVTAPTVATMALLSVWVATAAVLQSRRRQTPG